VVREETIMEEPMEKFSYTKRTFKVKFMLGMGERQLIYLHQGVPLDCTLIRCHKQIFG
jgi:hypothetical protein